MTRTCSSFIVSLGVLTMGATVAVSEAIRVETTPNGFSSSPRGWNSFGIQANPNVNPDFQFNQAGIISQCDILATTAALKDAGYVYCSLDSGWSVDDRGDDFGRIIYDDTKFDIPSLADHLHSQGLRLGVYVVPGAFLADESKTIFGTNITIGSVCSGDNGLSRCNLDYTQPTVQQWFNSVVDQFASWGVDMIKLDYVTPGSPSNGANLPQDSSGEVIAYHKAIAQSNRQIRLDISWKLDRSQAYFEVWNTNADSVRTDQDINNGRAATFVAWEAVQRAIDNYRQYITTVSQFGFSLTTYLDMDNLYVGNEASITGVSDEQRQTIMTHWLGAGANLLLGSDLTRLDEFGLNLLTNPRTLEIADFTARYPMQPRNPGTGENSPQQLQAWIAGPNETGSAVVIIANYGPNQGQGGWETSQPGVQAVNLSLTDLGITGTYDVVDIWADTHFAVDSSGFNVQLDEGQSVLYLLNP
ncbi:glycoside hydrolase superfamily [Biscogniauxia sp. FL1348]|nr:glycoside hydrolase superfamily [Biscogniauxia sp. FL1348]